MYVFRDECGAAASVGSVEGITYGGPRLPRHYEGGGFLNRVHADIDEGLYVGDRPPRVDPWDEHEPGVSRTTRRGMALALGMAVDVCSRITILVR